MVHIINWDQKLSTEINLAKPVKKFIERTYDSFDKDTIDKACKDFDEKRRIAVNKALDSNNKAIQIVSEYHDQVDAIMSKVPLLENGVAVNFAWKDAFSPTKRVINQSGNFEKACVLYNLAAMKMSVASTLNL